MMGLLERPVFEEAARDSFADSVWQATAIAAQQWPTLSQKSSADVTIIGAGYTGLSTALHLAERGARVTVLEAREPGFGASGRSGGQAVPLLRHEPDEIVARFGHGVGDDLVQMVAGSVDVLFDLVTKHKLECDAVRTGWIQGAYGRNGRALVRTRCTQWKRQGAPVRLLDSGELHALTGSRFYTEGWIHEGGGTVNPLGYVRSLAAAAQRAGVSIFANSPVLRLARNGERWVAACAGGQVESQRVVLATNGYTTGLWPGLKETVVPLYSMQVASTPLPAALAKTILPGGQSVADTRKVIWYFRRDRDGRFVIGSRGPFKARPSMADGAALVRSARKLYPALADVEFPFVWAGRVAMTADHMPHLHRLAPGVITALGYNGRGVAMATAMGRVVAAACLDDGERMPDFPITALKPIPFHAFNELGVRAVATYFRLLDRFA
ncbi:MAG: FAD-binding oxidoreductase [Betaproteobacteria bacterium]